MQETEEMQELLIYWQIVRKRLWLIGILVGTTLAVMLLGFYLAKPLYKASASFEVTAPLPAGVSLFQEYKTGSTREELFRTRNTYLAVLQSGLVLGQVIEEVGLEMEVSELLEKIAIQSDVESTFTEISVTVQDPRQAAAIANALLDKASQYFGEVGASSLTANKIFIQQQLQTTKEELDKEKAAFIQFKIENRVSSLEDLLQSQENLIRTLKIGHDEALAAGREDIVPGYAQVIAERERELQGLILLQAEYETLKANVARVEAIYSTLLAKETEAKLKENEVFSATYIQMMSAREPSSPLPRVDPKILILGGVGSLALGIMIAFILQAVEHTDLETDQDSISTVPGIARESSS
jgi:capsular polysaccharide biosynthesis protein